MKRIWIVALWTCAVGGVLASPEAASAQPLGPFRWQLLPYCNVVTLHVTQAGSILELAGFDDQCSAAQHVSAIGTAFLNTDGSIGMGLNTIVPSGAGFLHIDARIAFPSLGGTWRDSSGNSGQIVLVPGGGIGGPPRPAPSHNITRTIELTSSSWTNQPLVGINYYQAVLNVPEITAAVVERGNVQVFAATPYYGQPWTPLPFLQFQSAASVFLQYSVGPGEVVVRSSASNNGALNFGDGHVFKVVITP